eukprot:Em0019g1180a
MKHRHSCNMIERHVRALNRIAQNNEKGFFLKDVPDLCQLLTLCTERLHTSPEYEDPLCRIVELCSLPFLKEKASDEMTYTLAVIELLRTLGAEMKVGTEPLRGAVARSVATFCTSEPEPLDTEGFQTTKASFNVTLVERSAVAKAMVEVSDCTKDRQVQLDILHALQQLSTASANCDHILNVQGIHVICNLLAHADYETTFACIEIIWNLVDHGPKLKVMNQLSSLECLSILKRFLHGLMLRGNSQQTRQLRNDVLAMCSLMASQCPGAPFVETGFLADLCLFLSHPDLSRGHMEALGTFRYTREAEDFEMKKTLMCTLTTLATIDPAAVTILSAHKVLRHLLSFVVQNDKAGPEWNEAQFEELQLLALSCLCLMAPLSTEEYMTCQGNTRILLLVEWCMKPDGMFSGRGNSLHATGTRGTQRAQLLNSLRLLLNMCNTEVERVHQDLHEQGAIPILISLLKNLKDANEPVVIEIEANSLLILSSLCEQDAHRKELFGGYDGVPLLVQYLKRDISQFLSGLGHHRLLLAAIDCVWCAVIGSSSVEDIFLENGGAFVLLDFLKVCPSSMQNLVLGVLVDLCENPKTIPFVVSWRAHGDDSSAWSLLAQLWRAEEEELGVPRGPEHTLAGTVQPLVGSQQNECCSEITSTRKPSPAVLDVVANIRAKIYAIYCKLGFQLPDDKVSTEDKITFCIIQSYLDFKSGEVWYEVAGELAQEGLRPVTPDQECLQDILHMYEKKAEEVLKHQHELIDKQKDMDIAEEKAYYNKIIQLQQQHEKSQKDKEGYITRTSNYSSLKEAKLRQLTAIDSSRISGANLGDRLHTTDIQNINVTAFCGRNLSVSTIPPLKMVEKLS